MAKAVAGGDVGTQSGAPSATGPAFVGKAEFLNDPANT